MAPHELSHDINQVGFGRIVQVVDKNVRHYRELGVSGLRLEVKFQNPSPSNVEEWLEKCISELLSIASSELEIEPQDRVGLVFTNTNNVRAHFSISFRRFDQYSPEVILAALEKVIQSNTAFFVDDNLVVNIDHVKIPVGFGRRTHIGKTRDKFFKIHKRSIFQPELKEIHYGLCLPVSIVIAMAYVSDDINRYNFITYRGNYDDMISEAIKLSADANVPAGGCGIDEIIKFQNHLGMDYRITVFLSRDGRTIYFKSCHTSYKFVINLLLDDGHYSVILNPAGAFAASYFCGHCSTVYATKFGHKTCPLKCSSCFCQPACVKIFSSKCNDCNRLFVSTECFAKHLAHGICSVFKICTECSAPYAVKKRDKHECGLTYCKICKDKLPIRHNCYIAITKPKPKRKNGDLYIFYDFESTQTKQMGGDNTKFEHEIVLCVAQQACDKCRDMPDVNVDCLNCGKREHIFFQSDVVNDFMIYLGNINEKFTRIIILAHNSQKYDGHFLLKYMYSHSDVWKFSEESLIMTGSKIMCIKVGRYKFIDSLNFFNAPLSKLPKMFSLENNSKGHYPHMFNTHNNLNYVGVMPALEYYWPDSLRPAERDNFIAWYNEEKLKNKVFDNQVELKKYCIEDVNILRNACLKFRSILFDLLGIEPFYQITLASTAMTIFTTIFLKKEEISIIPRNGYRFTDNQSFKALKWLEWESHERNIKIQTAANGREVRIAHDIVVDGFYQPNIIFSFLGCYWHQCPKCFPNQFHTLPNNNKLKARSLYEAYQLRAEKIKNLGYQLVEMWEHEFDVLLKENPLIQAYIDTLDHLKVDPLNPRDAFMGGRTGVCRLYHKCLPNEKILYQDVTSLYPYINKYGRYPTGCPKILVGADLAQRTVFDIDGILKVDILPPKKLYHPVLGVRLHSKLMFVLCFKCACEQNSEECTHSDSERMIRGTYVADELRLAVSKGYIIMKIYEAWEYEMIQFDPTTNTGGLFAGYIDTFLKIKTEASGFPSWCVSPNSREQYIKEYYEHEGIILDESKIAKNEGYRSLAKLLLNSLWGRLGMRQDKDKKVFVKYRTHLLNLMTNPSLEINSFSELSKEALLVSYKMREECTQIHPNVNVVLAAYTAAQARMHLYSYLDKLQSRCLYYDTDSVIYTCKEGEYRLPLGDHLGELTDELTEFGENCYISEAVFTAEKSYAFIVKVPGGEDRTKCKVKGINLNFKNSESINFESLKNLVLSDQTGIITIENDVILRTCDSTVYTTAQKYRLKVNATKRVKIGPKKIDTEPYGFQNEND